jgi:lysyl-tRNA synthetase class 2
MSEDNLIKTKQDKIQKWNELGFESYHNNIDNNAQKVTIGKLINYYQKDIDTGKVFSVNGRIMSMRKQGGVRFLNLINENEKIQLFVSKKDIDVEKYWNIFQHLDIGDIVNVSGELMRTTSGELSIRLKTICPLTKCLIAPTKDGATTTIENSELKYRQRYRDLIENSESYNVFIARSQIIKAIREFMEQKLCSMEVETPILTNMRSGANAKPFETHHNALNKDLYLRIAPELYLKRLLVGGFNNVFEIGRLFRNEGISTKHNPEFTAIEYYQAYADYKVLIKQTKDMLNFIALYPKTGYDLEKSSFNLDCVEIKMIDAVILSLSNLYGISINSWNALGGNLNWTEVQQLISDILIKNQLTELNNDFCQAILRKKNKNNRRISVCII